MNKLTKHGALVKEKCLAHWGLTVERQNAQSLLEQPTLYVYAGCGEARLSPEHLAWFLCWRRGRLECKVSFWESQVRSVLLHICALPRPIRLAE